jgi:phosphoserine phosphatase
MVAQPMLEFDPTKPDAVFDIDGTITKFTTLEQFTGALSTARVFDPIPPEVEAARSTWKTIRNNESNYTRHTNGLVKFFVEQIAHKQTADLHAVARTVAAEHALRRWDITRGIIDYLRPTHNVMSISHMPRFLMPHFTEGLNFVKMIGSTYVGLEGRFTGEAHGIDKAEAYLEHRKVKDLDVVMGDTMGDLSLLRIARRPIVFNPSHTLVCEADPTMTVVRPGKDAVSVMNRIGEGNLFIAQEFDCSQVEAVLGSVAEQWSPLTQLANPRQANP